MRKSTIQFRLFIRIFTNVTCTHIYMRMLYSQYDKEWSAVEHDYGNVYNMNLFHELTENEVGEKRLY